MGKIEKAVKGLECCTLKKFGCPSPDCPYSYAKSDYRGDCIYDLCADALELLKAKDINVPTKWISVKDRLPTHGEYVLTLDSQGNYYIDQVLRDGRWQETECEWNPVKWWMPLPERPKEGDGE
jgi:hypothetical protein